MQNPSILNTLSATPAQPAKARPADNSDANQQFTQLLTRQMNERQAARPASNTEHAAKPVAQKQVAQAKPADKSPSAVTAAPTPPTAATATPPTESKTTDAKAKTEDQPTDTTAAAPVNSTDAALNASAAIMALVANAGQAASDPADAKKSDLALAGLAGDGAGAGARRDIKALPEGTLTDAAIKDVLAKGAGEFGATLDDAAAARPVADLAMADLPALTPTLTPVQQTTLAAAAPAGINPGNSLAPPIDNSGWDQALGQRMLWMVAGSEQSASLTLNPPDLGPLQVVLNVSNGQADASFFAAQPEVRQALEAALPRLREMMGDAGITLGQASVSSGNPQQQGDSGQGNRRTETSNSNQPDQGGSTGVTARRISGSGNGMVDTFA